MTVGLRDHVPELGRLPLLFRETFRDRPSVEANGATLVGTGTTFGPDGMALNGSGNLSYAVSGSSILRSTLTCVIEFTLGFAWADNQIRYLFRADNAGGTAYHAIAKSATNSLELYFGATACVSIASATMLANLVAGKNVLVVSTTTGATTAWLNGTSIGTSATAWSLKNTTLLKIGSSYNDTTRFIGTIHAIEIYGNVSTAVDEPYLRNKTLISALDNPLVVLPGTSFYKRASDSKYVTEVRGKAGITEALMGSDGTTTTQFPSIIRPRGFSFDGGDQINLGDSDQFSFTNGVNDLPFSVAFIFKVSTAANAILVAKSTAYVSLGEFTIYASFAASGKYSVGVCLIDQTAVAYLFRYQAAAPLIVGKEYIGVFTYSGGGLAGMKTYIDTERHDFNSITNGVYVCMRNTTAPLIIGGAVTAIAALNGQVKLVPIFDYELSPLQVRALSRRLLAQSRRP